jgi:hypothetical protein
MGFNQTQRVVDAWASTKAMRGPWALLLWLARHCDQETGRITRSQLTIARDLGVSTRTVREYLRPWREAGVVVVLAHGGGPRRQVAILQVSLRALEDHMIKLARATGCRPPTQEVSVLPELNCKSVERNQLASGVKT